MNKLDFRKLYGHIGTVLCAMAGAIVGYLAGGAVLAIIGVPAGYIVGRFLDKQIALAALENIK